MKTVLGNYNSLYKFLAFLNPSKSNGEYAARNHGRNHDQKQYNAANSYGNNLRNSIDAENIISELHLP